MLSKQRNGCALDLIDRLSHCLPMMVADRACDQMICEEVDNEVADIIAPLPDVERDCVQST